MLRGGVVGCCADLLGVRGAWLSFSLAPAIAYGAAPGQGCGLRDLQHRLHASPRISIARPQLADTSHPYGKPLILSTSAAALRRWKPALCSDQDFRHEFSARHIAFNLARVAGSGMLNAFVRD